jgi:hypothetical protein
MDNVKAIAIIGSIGLGYYVFGTQFDAVIVGIIVGYVLGVNSRNEEVLKLSKRIWALEPKAPPQTESMEEQIEKSTQAMWDRINRLHPHPLQADPKPGSEYPSVAGTPEKT